MENLSTQKKKVKFKVGDIIALSLKGFYRVEAIDKMAFAGTEQEVYILGNILEKTIHKTFLPVGAEKAQGARTLVKEKEITAAESKVESFELSFEPLKNNSNKKMIAYEKRVKVGGYWSMIEVYLNVCYDLYTTKRLDKRYVAFKDRVKELICSEIALVLDITKDSATERFQTIEKKAQLH